MSEKSVSRSRSLEFARAMEAVIVAAWQLGRGEEDLVDGSSLTATGRSNALSLIEISAGSR